MDELESAIEDSFEEKAGSMPRLHAQVHPDAGLDLSFEEHLEAKRGITVERISRGDLRDLHRRGLKWHQAHELHFKHIFDSLIAKSKMDESLQTPELRRAKAYEAKPAPRQRSRRSRQERSHEARFKGEGGDVSVEINSHGHLMQTSADRDENVSVAVRSDGNMRKMKTGKVRPTMSSGLIDLQTSPPSPTLSDQECARRVTQKYPQLIFAKKEKEKQNGRAHVTCATDLTKDFKVSCNADNCNLKKSVYSQNHKFCFVTTNVFGKSSEISFDVKKECKDLRELKQMLLGAHLFVMREDMLAGTLEVYCQTQNPGTWGYDSAMRGTVYFQGCKNNAIGCWRKAGDTDFPGKPCHKPLRREFQPNDNVVLRVPHRDNKGIPANAIGTVLEKVKKMGSSVIVFLIKISTTGVGHLASEANMRKYWRLATPDTAFLDAGVKYKDACLERAVMNGDGEYWCKELRYGIQLRFIPGDIVRDLDPRSKKPQDEHKIVVDYKKEGDEVHYMVRALDSPEIFVRPPDKIQYNEIMDLYANGPQMSTIELLFKKGNKYAKLPKGTEGTLSLTDGPCAEPCGSWLSVGRWQANYQKEAENAANEYLASPQYKNDEIRSNKSDLTLQHEKAGIVEHFKAQVKDCMETPDDKTSDERAKALALAFRITKCGQQEVANAYAAGERLVRFRTQLNRLLKSNTKNTDPRDGVHWLVFPDGKMGLKKAFDGSWYFDAEYNLNNTLSKFDFELRVQADDVEKELPDEVSPRSNIRPSEISVAICVLIDIDLFTLTGGFPGTITIGMQGMVRYLPAKACWGWQFFLKLQLSIGFSVGGVDFKIGIVFAGTLMLTEVPLSVATADLAVAKLPSKWVKNQCNSGKNAIAVMSPAFGTIVSRLAKKFFSRKGTSESEKKIAQALKKERARYKDLGHYSEFSKMAPGYRFPSEGDHEWYLKFNWAQSNSEFNTRSSQVSIKPTFWNSLTESEAPRVRMTVVQIVKEAASQTSPVAAMAVDEINRNSVKDDFVFYLKEGVDFWYMIEILDQEGNKLFVHDWVNVQPQHYESRLKNLHDVRMANENQLFRHILSIQGLDVTTDGAPRCSLKHGDYVQVDVRTGETWEDHEKSKWYYPGGFGNVAPWAVSLPVPAKDARVQSEKKPLDKFGDSLVLRLDRLSGRQFRRLTEDGFWRSKTWKDMYEMMAKRLEEILQSPRRAALQVVRGDVVRRFLLDVLNSQRVELYVAKAETTLLPALKRLVDAVGDNVPPEMTESCAEDMESGDRGLGGCGERTPSDIPDGYFEKGESWIYERERTKRELNNEACEIVLLDLPEGCHKNDTHVSREAKAEKCWISMKNKMVDGIESLYKNLYIQWHDCLDVPLCVQNECAVWQCNGEGVHLSGSNAGITVWKRYRGYRQITQQIRLNTMAVSMAPTYYLGSKLDALDDEVLGDILDLMHKGAFDTQWKTALKDLKPTKAFAVTVSTDKPIDVDWQGKFSPVRTRTDSQKTEYHFMLKGLSETKEELTEKLEQKLEGQTKTVELTVQASWVLPPALIHVCSPEFVRIRLQHALYEDSKWISNREIKAMSTEDEDEQPQPEPTEADDRRVRVIFGVRGVDLWFRYLPGNDVDQRLRGAPLPDRLPDRWTAETVFKVPPEADDGCHYNVRLDFLHQGDKQRVFDQKVLARQRPNLVPVAEALFAASQQFIGKLPFYMAQVRERLTENDNEQVETRMFRQLVDKAMKKVAKGYYSSKYKNTDGRYLHRHLTTKEKEEVKVAKGDLGSKDWVYNFPRALKESIHKENATFWYNAGLSVANLFIRTLGDIQAIFNLYFADHPDWDGSCGSLPPSYHLFFEWAKGKSGKGGRASQWSLRSNWASDKITQHSTTPIDPNTELLGANPYRAALLVSQMGPEDTAQLEEDRRLILNWHWVSQANVFSFKEKRADFFRKTPPVMGMNGWGTIDPSQMSAVMYPHLWCELVQQKWQKDGERMMVSALQAGDKVLEDLEDDFQEPEEMDDSMFGKEWQDLKKERWNQELDEAKAVLEFPIWTCQDGKTDKFAKLNATTSTLPLDKRTELGKYLKNVISFLRDLVDKMSDQTKIFLNDHVETVDALAVRSPRRILRQPTNAAPVNDEEGEASSFTEGIRKVPDDGNAFFHALRCSAEIQSQSAPKLLQASPSALSAWLAGALRAEPGADADRIDQLQRGGEYTEEDLKRAAELLGLRIMIQNSPKPEGYGDAAHTPVIIKLNEDRTFAAIRRSDDEDVECNFGIQVGKLGKVKKIYEDGTVDVNILKNGQQEDIWRFMMEELKKVEAAKVDNRQNQEESQDEQELRLEDTSAPSMLRTRLDKLEDDINSLEGRDPDEQQESSKIVLEKLVDELLQVKDAERQKDKNIEDWSRRMGEVSKLGSQIELRTMEEISTMTDIMDSLLNVVAPKIGESSLPEEVTRVLAFRLQEARHLAHALNRQMFRNVIEAKMLVNCLEKADEREPLPAGIFKPWLANAENEAETWRGKLAEVEMIPRDTKDTTEFNDIVFYFQKPCRVPVDHKFDRPEFFSTFEVLPERPECEQVLLNKGFSTLYPSLVTAAHSLYGEFHNDLEELLGMHTNTPLVDRKNLVESMLRRLEGFFGKDSNLMKDMHNDFYMAFGYQGSDFFGDLWGSVNAATIRIANTIQDRVSMRSKHVTEFMAAGKYLKKHRLLRVGTKKAEDKEKNKVKGIPTEDPKCLCKRAWTQSNGAFWRYKGSFQGCATPAELKKANEDVGGHLKYVVRIWEEHGGNGKAFVREIDESEWEKWAGLCKTTTKSKAEGKCKAPWAKCTPEAEEVELLDYEVYRHTDVLQENPVKLPLVTMQFSFHVDIRTRKANFCVPNGAPLMIAGDFTWTVNSWNPFDCAFTACITGRVFPIGMNLGITYCKHTKTNDLTGDKKEHTEWRLVSQIFVMRQTETIGSGAGDKLQTIFGGGGDGQLGTTSYWSLWKKHGWGMFWENPASPSWAQTEDLMQADFAWYFSMVANIMTTFAASQWIKTRDESTKGTGWWKSLLMSVLLNIWKVLFRFGAIPQGWSLGASSAVISKLNYWRENNLALVQTQRDLIINIKWTKEYRYQTRKTPEMLKEFTVDQLLRVVKALREKNEVKFLKVWDDHVVETRGEDVANHGRAVAEMRKKFLRRYIKAYVEARFGQEDCPSLDVILQTFMGLCGARPIWYQVKKEQTYPCSQPREAYFLKRAPPKINDTLLMFPAAQAGWLQQVKDPKEENAYYSKDFLRKGNLVVVAYATKPQPSGAELELITYEQFKWMVDRANPQQLWCWSDRIRQSDVGGLKGEDLLEKLQRDRLQELGVGLGKNDRYPLEVFGRKYMAEFLSKNWDAILRDVVGKTNQKDFLTRLFKRGNGVQIEYNPAGVGSEKLEKKTSALAIALQLQNRLQAIIPAIPGSLKITPTAKFAVTYNLRDVISSLMALIRTPTKKPPVVERQKRVDLCIRCVESDFGFCDRQHVANQMLKNGWDESMDECLDRDIEGVQKCRRFTVSPSVHRNKGRLDALDDAGVAFLDIKTGSDARTTLIKSVDICPCYDSVTGDEIFPEWFTTKQHCEDMRWPGQWETQRLASKASDWLQGFAAVEFDAQAGRYQVNNPPGEADYDTRMANMNYTIYKCPDGYGCCTFTKEGNAYFACVHWSSTRSITQWKWSCEPFHPPGVVDKWAKAQRDSDCSYAPAELTALASQAAVLEAARQDEEGDGANREDVALEEFEGNDAVLKLGFNGFWKRVDKVWMRVDPTVVKLDCFQKLTAKHPGKFRVVAGAKANDDQVSVSCTGNDDEPKQMTVRCGVWPCSEQVFCFAIDPGTGRRWVKYEIDVNECKDDAEADEEGDEDEAGEDANE